MFEVSLKNKSQAIYLCLRSFDARENHSPDVKKPPLRGGGRDGGFETGDKGPERGIGLCPV